MQILAQTLFNNLEQECGELEAAVKGALAAAGLQAPAPLVSKVLQLHNTLDVRMGVMLVRGDARAAGQLLGGTGRGQAINCM